MAKLTADIRHFSDSGTIGYTHTVCGKSVPWMDTKATTLKWEETDCPQCLAGKQAFLEARAKWQASIRAQREKREADKRNAEKRNASS